MLREWRWWGQYRPSSKIVEVGILEITKHMNEYRMELKIDVKYTSGDNRHDTLMDITDVYLDVYNRGKGRDRKPYRLARSDRTLEVHPIKRDSDGWLAVVALLWRLPCGESVLIRYDFWGHIDAPPLIGKSTFCKILAIGKAKIEGITESRQLRIDDKFSVMVDKEYEK